MEVVINLPAKETFSEGPVDNVVRFDPGTRTEKRKTQLPGTPPMGKRPSRHPAARKVGCLILVRGDAPGREIRLETDEFTIGRGKECDLVLADITCSRNHARIRRQGGSYILIDDNSGNGTLLNSKFVSRSVLREGDRLAVGRTILQFIRVVPSACVRPQASPHPVTSFDLPVLQTRKALLARPLCNRRRLFFRLFILGALVGFTVIAAIFLSSLTSSQTENQVLQARRQKNLETLARVQEQLIVAREATKKQDWETAATHTRLALTIDPHDQIAQDYQAFIKSEIACKSALQAARKHVRRKSYNRAIAAITIIGPTSSYHDEAQRLRARISKLLRSGS